MKTVPKTAEIQRVLNVSPRSLDAVFYRSFVGVWVEKLRKRVAISVSSGYGRRPICKDSRSGLCFCRSPMRKSHHITYSVFARYVVNSLKFAGWEGRDLEMLSEKSENR
jgi:hypothetical protein